MPSLADMRQAKRTFCERVFDKSLIAYRESSSKQRRASIASTVDTPFNVVGVLLGYKETGGRDSFERCLRVLVRKKVANANLSKNVRIPGHYDGIATDIIQVGHIKAATGACDIPTSRARRPVPCGVSVSGFGTGAGSLGYVFRRKNSAKLVILSNYHVLAPSAPSKKSIYQPGLGDGDLKPSNIIGEFQQGVPIRFIQNGKSPANMMDAAIASIQASKVKDVLCSAGKLKPQVIAPTSKMQVWMFGKTSRGVRGVILGESGDIIIKIGTRFALFRHQIEIGPVNRPRFGQPGDSGSIVVDFDRRICALFFATDGAFHGFATPAKRVVNKLKLVPV